MFDFAGGYFKPAPVPGTAGSKKTASSWMRGGLKTYRNTKRLFDLVLCVLVLPATILAGLILLILNPFYNRGSLFFLQERMGRNNVPFTIVKFRTMQSCKDAMRGADDPLEVDRITPLGHFLRRTRIDEMPQILNILAGQMSFVGPRPDSYQHALVYLELVPGYRSRHEALPGITGLAQTEVGYVQGIDATRRKVAADIYYIRHASLRLEAWILWRTFLTVIKLAGQ